MTIAATAPNTLFGDLGAQVVVDLFCGGGGASSGIVAGLAAADKRAGRAVRREFFALNHNHNAIINHRKNHPTFRHFEVDIFDFEFITIGRGRTEIEWLHASPSCKHHSNARGGRPMREQERTGAWKVLEAIRALRPRRISMENVREFLSWGPLHPDDHPVKKLRGRPIQERKGEFYREWIEQIRALGYHVEWRLLQAHHYGEPTIRERWYLLARRDGEPINWPAPTHGPGLLPYRQAAECIDFDNEGHSAFLTPQEAKALGIRVQRPLASATMARIWEGFRRFVLEAERPFLLAKGEDGRWAPFLVNTRNGEREGQTPRVRPVDEPYWTLTAQGSQGAVVAPHLLQLTHGGRLRAVDEPLSTITAAHRGETAVVAPSLVQLSHGGRVRDLSDPMPTTTGGGGRGGGHTALVSAFVAKHYGGGPNGVPSAGQPVDDPLATITATGQLGPVLVYLSREAVGPRAELVADFVMSYYGEGGQGAPADEPLRTITCLARHGLVRVLLVHLNDDWWVVNDIKLRMLTSEELKLAQGFPADYVLIGTEAERIERIGNSVCPGVMRALVEANA